MPISRISSPDRTAPPGGSARRFSRMRAAAQCSTPIRTPPRSPGSWHCCRSPARTRRPCRRRRLRSLGACAPRTKATRLRQQRSRLRLRGHPIPSPRSHFRRTIPWRASHRRPETPRSSQDWSGCVPFYGRHRRAPPPPMGRWPGRWRRSRTRCSRGCIPCSFPRPRHVWRRRATPFPRSRRDWQISTPRRARTRHCATRLRICWPPPVIPVTPPPNGHPHSRHASTRHLYSRVSPTWGRNCPNSARKLPPPRVARGRDSRTQGLRHR